MRKTAPSSRASTLTLVALALLALLLAPEDLGAAGWEALPQELSVPQGGLVVLALPAEASGLEARAFGRSFPVHAAVEASVLLIPASYHLQPGNYPLTLRSPAATRTLTLKVTPREFPVQALIVPPSTEQKARPVETEAQQRQAREAQEVAAARESSAPVPLWQGPFLWPVTGRITSEFGLIRTVNGVPSGRHSGLDIAVPEGTPVRAANAGVVVLAANHLTNGNTVIIDHGWRLSTSYLHLKEIHVREGQEVAKGQIIGLAGSTGFATGPHLHWTARVDGVFIDPRALIDSALAF